MQVPITPQPMRSKIVPVQPVSEAAAMIAAQLQHAQGRLVDPDTSVEAWSRNLEDRRDPTKGVGGKTPDVSVHSQSLTQGSSPRGGYAEGYGKNPQRRGVDSSTVDDHDTDTTLSGDTTHTGKRR